MSMCRKASDFALQERQWGVGERECGFPRAGMFGICCTPATLPPSPWGVLGGRESLSRKELLHFLLQQQKMSLSQGMHLMSYSE